MKYLEIKRGIILTVFAILAVFCVMTVQVRADGSSDTEGQYRLNIWYESDSGDVRQHGGFSSPQTLEIMYGSEKLTLETYQAMDGLYDLYGNITLDEGWLSGKEVKLVNIPAPDGYDVCFSGQPVLKFGTGKFTNPNTKIINCMIPVVKKGAKRDINKTVVYFDNGGSIPGTFAYTGKAVKPGITVIDSWVPLQEGIDYKVSYKNNVNFGVDSKVVITGIGKYTGTKEASFKILPTSKSVGKTFSYGNFQYKITKVSGTKYYAALNKVLTKKTSVTIPYSIKKNGCSFSVTGVSQKAFYKDTKVKKLTVGATITSIGNKAFYGCTSLTKVTFQNKKLTTIGDSAFGNCKKLTSFTVPVSVKTIGAKAFSGDAKLKSIKIQSTKLKKVGTKAFSGINKKAVIKVPSKKLKAYKKLLKNKGQKASVKITK